ncbi:substrate-binding domain-containing protein [Faecalicatena contorta]|uniref:Monosaccharide ABC transporter substrate-binding protein, CUT2 family n=1 Tax=Faecalicatena contorta TaxID=39482 RepID=A0A315ZZX2_9FIRM|nr:substrate-binding domain-containing protein [Faecalicatena contorta]PWJ50822.1 monosaccharide ABC transporter substrate-binding protein (CUT2 family) [Faecalicatena contorta]SUQ13390.1 monosaccharide ABC transporter substrate-binding protein, CUT2 family [Faecalicatena contorta]
MSRRITSGILILALLLVLCGCKSTQAEATPPELIIGVVAKSDATEYWMSVRSGMEAAAKRNGCRILFFAPDAEESAEAQEKLASALIRRRVDVLAVSPIDAVNEPAYLKEARKLGIPVISYDSAFESGEIAYIGIDNHLAGYQMAANLAKRLEYQGEIGIVSGELNQMCHRERVEGVKEYIKTVPEMKITYIESGYSGAKMSGEKLAQLRREHPEVKGLVVTSAVTALGIIESFEAVGLSIVTIDVQEDVLYALKNKHIVGLVAQSGYDIGYETINYARELKAGREKEKNIIIEAEFLTAENVEDYLEKHTQ